MQNNNKNIFNHLLKRSNMGNCYANVTYVKEGRIKKEKLRASSYLKNRMIFRNINNEEIAIKVEDIIGAIDYEYE